MSSPALSDSQVLRAFTAAYNDKFRELMRTSDAGPSSPAPSGCSACRSSVGASRPTVVEVVEVAKASGLGASRSQGGGGGGAFWTVVLVLAALALLFILGSWFCKAYQKRKVVLAGTPLSVEASMGGGVGGAGVTGGRGAVKDVSDPSQAVPTAGKSIVMYHATWCGHCKTMRPLFDRAAEAAGGSHQVSFLACEHEMLEKSGKGQQLGIQGYPTLIVFDAGSRKGELVGAVGADKLKAFIQEHTR